MRKISACFRIYSDVLTPVEVAERVGIPATRGWHRGDTRGGRAIESNLWEFEIDYDDTEGLDRVIAGTLEALESARSEIAELGGVERVVWCAVFSDAPETTVSLSPATLGGMAGLRAELNCSIYAASFDDESPSTLGDPASAD